MKNVGKKEWKDKKKKQWKHLKKKNHISTKISLKKLQQRKKVQLKSWNNKM